MSFTRKEKSLFDDPYFQISRDTEDYVEVVSITLDELRAKELVKYSPIKQLTSEQGQLITEIINNPNKNYVINGDAGTGKTVLLTHLVASILKDRPRAKIGVVVQPNWEKTGANIFKVYGMNSSYLSVTTTTK